MAGFTNYSAQLLTWMQDARVHGRWWRDDNGGGMPRLPLPDLGAEVVRLVTKLTLVFEA